MVYSYLLNILRTNNPFATDSVADPWEDNYPSVATINARAFQELGDLIMQKASNPALAIGALMQGESGSGKTHMIKRVAETVHTARRPLLVANIQPIEDPQFPFTYLLREIIGNLQRPMTKDGTSTTQLDRLISRWLIDLVGMQLSAAMAARFQDRPERILNSDLSDLDFSVQTAQELPKELLKVLSYYHQKHMRPYVADWLAGRALDQEHLDILKVPDRLTATTKAREAESLELLVALGEMFTNYNYCLLVCFDRWENLDTSEQLKATGRMIGELFDRIKGMLPLVLVRRLDWDEDFSKNINQYLVSRLENNCFVLKGCTREDAVTLIKSRLAHVLKSDASDIEPFSQEQIDIILGVGSLSPRSIIKLANEQLRNLLYAESIPENISPSVVLEKEFTTRYKKAVGDFSQYAPDRGRLQRALQVLLEKVPGITLLEPMSSVKDKVDLNLHVKTKTGISREIALIIDLEQHHRAVGAAIDRGLQYLNTATSHQVVYVRDSRYPIPSLPKWPATNERREQLEQQGALLWTLNAEQAAGWYALADLAYAVKAGDITQAQGGRLNIISTEELGIWAAKLLQEHSAFVTLWKFLQKLDTETLKEPTAAETTIKDIPGALLDACTNILKTGPTRMISCGALCNKLVELGYAVENKSLLTFLNQHKDHFDVITSRDDAVIMLNTDCLG